MTHDEILKNPAFFTTLAHEADDAEFKKVFKEQPSVLAIVASNTTVWRDEFFRGLNS